MKSIRQIRDEAADLLEREGWCQGNFRQAKPEGGYRYCMIGACREVAGYSTAAAADAYAAAAACDAADAAYAAAQWNDTEGRTAAEVIAALRAP